MAPSQATVAAHPSAQSRPFRPPHFRSQSGDQRVYSARRHGLPQLSRTDSQREGGKSLTRTFLCLLCFLNTIHL